MKISIHHHTFLSGDNYLQKVTLEKVLDKAFKENIDVLAITDSNNDEAIDHIKKTQKPHVLSNGVIQIKSKEKNLFVLRGMEHRKKQGHSLLIGYEDSLMDKTGWGWPDLQKEVHDQGGLFILTHPLNATVKGISKENIYLLNSKEPIDGLEWNANNINLAPYFLNFKKYNQQTEEIAKELNIPVIPGDDSHSIDQIGTSYIEMDSLPTTFSIFLKESLKEKIKNNNFKATKKYQNPKSTFGWGLKRYLKN